MVQEADGSSTLTGEFQAATLICHELTLLFPGSSVSMSSTLTGWRSLYLWSGSRQRCSVQLKMFLEQLGSQTISCTGACIQGQRSCCEFARQGGQIGGEWVEWLFKDGPNSWLIDWEWLPRFVQYRIKLVYKFQFHWKWLFKGLVGGHICWQCATCWQAIILLRERHRQLINYCDSFKRAFLLIGLWAN